MVAMIDALLYPWDSGRHLRQRQQQKEGESSLTFAEAASEPPAAAEDPRPTPITTARILWWLDTSMVLQ
ncbi:hypothetical protein R1flu_008963 [Riccia fluitans]|uniref:Uncharacterized protein n=1 Tax=Riccia fluitans TaxID=41844 RepID=A0ABD1Z0R7_9MARC